jgi:hypothetical protein
MKAFKEFVKGFIFPFTLGINYLLIYVLLYAASWSVFIVFGLILILVALSVIMCIGMFTSQKIFIYAPIFSLFLIIVLFLIGYFSNN